MTYDLDTLTRLAQAATPGMRTLAHMIPDSVIWSEKEKRFALLRGSKSDIELAYSCSPDTILGLVAQLRDHEEAHIDKQRLVREIDVILNGEEGAAEQASLCDLVGQIQTLVARVRKLEEALELCKVQFGHIMNSHMNCEKSTDEKHQMFHLAEEGVKISSLVLIPSEPRDG